MKLCISIYCSHFCDKEWAHEIVAPRSEETPTRYARDQMNEAKGASFGHNAEKVA